MKKLLALLFSIFFVAIISAQTVPANQFGNSGNVGIGTNNPNFPLEVYGQSKFHGKVGVDSIATFSDTLIMMETSRVDEDFIIAGDLIMEKYISTTLQAPVLAYLSPNGVLTTSENVSCVLGKDNNYYPIWESGIEKIFTYCPDQAFKIGINTSNPLQELDVRGSGYFSNKVGIGTSSPLEILDVVGKIQSSNNGRQLKLWADPTKNSNYIRSTNDQAGNVTLVFEGGDNTDWLTIFNNGNIGINNSLPTKKLEITDGALLLSGSNGSDGNARFIIEDDGTTADFVQFNNGTNNILRITNSGKLYARSIEVLDIVAFPDYVFEPDYELMTLKELDEYIKINKHLPNIPDANEVEANGMDLAEMNILLLEKIEEITLYILEVNKKLEIQQNIIDEFKREL